MRVHRQYWVKGPLSPSCFKDLPNPGSGMSTDWSKYRTAATTRFAKGEANAPNYGVVSLSVERIRAISEPTRQQVLHDPVPDNRAHSLVVGDKPPRVRVLFLRECDCQVVIHCDDPVTNPE